MRLPETPMEQENNQARAEDEPCAAGESAETAIKAAARDAGFSACGIASVDSEADDGFDAWLDTGMHAGMEWMARTRQVRQQVRQFLPGARSVVALAVNYYAEGPPRPEGMRGRVSRYAWGRDYHRALRRRAWRVAEAIRKADPSAAVRVSIDSAPVRERAWGGSRKTA